LTALNNQNNFIRLVTLWIIIEAFLGGIIHAIKLPISGILVGGGALLCICMIAYYCDEKTAILKATVLVAIFKLLLSPHSPPPAYFAVFFQGVLGCVILNKTNWFTLRACLLGAICFFESAFQRVIITTLIYGKDFWLAINQFIQGLTHEKELTNYSLTIIVGFICLHILLGIVLGFFISKIPQKLTSFTPLSIENINLDDVFKKSISPSMQSKINWSILFAVIISTIYIFSSIRIFNVGKLWLQVISILFRSVVVLIIWKYLIGPILNFYIKSYLQKTSKKYQKQIETINQILPEIKSLLNEAWSISRTISRSKRIQYFVLHVLHGTIYHGEK
jgi:hypothetical protein